MSEALINQEVAVFADAPTPGSTPAPGIGRIRRVPLRDVWRHEALDFTRWLQENMDVLNDLTGLSLQNVSREQSAGSFNVDLVGEDAAGNTVIIENQLEKSDHDHLGKLITYLSALEAKTAIWIVAEPRPEHIQAINWLNGSASASFYLLKVEAIRIDESRPAPLLTLITGPSETTMRAGETKRELAERHINRFQFWTGLLEIVRSRTKLHANLTPTHDNWLSTSAGKAGLSFSYLIRMQDADVHLYIDRGKDADAANLAVFDHLNAHRAAIEAAYGGTLRWERLEGKRACRISAPITTGGLRDQEKWPEVQEAMVDAMIRLEAALRPYLSQLPV